MKWEQVPDSEPANVIAVLEREAERLEQDAVQLQAAARQLAARRWSSVRSSKPNAFGASIEFLTRTPG